MILEKGVPFSTKQSVCQSVEVLDVCAVYAQTLQNAHRTCSKERLTKDGTEEHDESPVNLSIKK
jgi:hypothetical protein